MFDGAEGFGREHTSLPFSPPDSVGVLASPAKQEDLLAPSAAGSCGSLVPPPATTMPGPSLSPLPSGALVERTALSTSLVGAGDLALASPSSSLPLAREGETFSSPPPTSPTKSESALPSPPPAPTLHVCRSAIDGCIAQPPPAAGALPFVPAAPADGAAVRKRDIESTSMAGGGRLAAAAGMSPKPGGEPPFAGSPCMRPPAPSPPPPLIIATTRPRAVSPCDELSAALDSLGLRADGELVSAEQLGAVLAALPTAPLPAIAAGVLWRAIPATPGGGAPASSLFSWFAQNLTGLPADDWLLPLLAGGAGATHASREHLLGLARDVAARHPGLAFLADAPDFQEHYAATVVGRVLYALDPLRAGRIGVRELRRGGKLWRALEALGPGGAAERDVNAERAFFSYEHFYVIYCAFCRLDEDSDHLLDVEDLSRYGGHSLSRRAAERVYACRRRAAADGLMEYEDFLYFILSEEHKGSRTATGYWFRVLDVDGDGLLTLDDIAYFYEEQVRRLVALGHEPVSFTDVAAQLFDAVKPRSRRGIALSDLRRCKLAPLFIGTLTNIHRFLAGEVGDMRAQLGVPGAELNEWDVWASAEYARLEEEDEDEDGGMADLMELYPADSIGDAEGKLDDHASHDAIMHDAPPLKLGGAPFARGLAAEAPF